ncbi:peptidoglycan-binding protein [Nostocaceae cyanobacterium CENA357]|uniref:Peptidoglycan-binding protein n=1 Tax=Atlanticothrix silvestris CENA357 TaxID=1725252 RepID=A0A8J7L4S5_9CYAN|nr:peptidoglycan-binding protein [Atlanticothrix silvestris]MBH8556295.1 peptidoglycan-binding protein [Atlanticothrix silvestris CENA357]
MEAIVYLHLASVYETSENIEIIPIQVNLKFLQWQKLSSTAAMRLLSVALTMGLLSVAGQTLALQKEGSNSTEVGNIQRCLKKLGYFNGPVTGKFATLTKTSVVKFQQANRLTADGVVGASTQQALQRACRSQTPSGNSINGLRVGSRGADVSRLQQDLRKLRYFNGPSTGYFGPQTQQAVIRFQRAYGIAADGIVGSRTTQAILSNQRPSNPRPSNFGEGGEYPVLSEGSSGAAVTRLQQRLRQLGYFNANPTGNFRRITKDAVIAFQRKAGIPTTGVANQQTWDALLGYSRFPTRGNIAASQVKDLQQYLRDLGYFNTTPTGTVGPLTRDAIARFQRDNRLNVDGNADVEVLEAVRRVWENRYATQPASQATRTFLSVGDRGENVRAVQERLLQLNFFNGNPDGNFGDYTRGSVIAFQQSYGLNPTGNVDLQTWQALGLNGATVANSYQNNGYVMVAPPVNTGFPIGNSYQNNRYIVVVPFNNNDILNRVRLYIPNAFSEQSSLGNYVNAGAFSDRESAERISKMLRSNGFDARVQYF